MVIHSARPQAAGTTQNKPLTTNGPKNPDPSIDPYTATTRRTPHVTPTPSIVKSGYTELCR